jgi:hypothetical protein
MEKYYQKLSSTETIRDEAIESIVNDVWKADTNSDNKLSMAEWKEHALVNPGIQKLLMLSQVDSKNVNLSDQ